MTPTQYLNSILSKYTTLPTLLLQLSPTYHAVVPRLRTWGYPVIREIKISGSNAKGTAIAGDVDLDLFISLDPSVLSTHTLTSIYDSLVKGVQNAGYVARRQSVSVRINHVGMEVDIVPGVKFAGNTNDHWLHVTKSGRDRTKTNIDTHINRVVNSGRVGEIRLVKIWRKLNNLDFPSIYLEETVINCLSGYRIGNLETNFLRVMDFLSGSFANTTVIDPANSSNVISDDLTVVEKNVIGYTASISKAQPTWGTIVW